MEFTLKTGYSNHVPTKIGKVREFLKNASVLKTMVRSLTLSESSYFQCNIWKSGNNRETECGKVWLIKKEKREPYSVLSTQAYCSLTSQIIAFVFQ